VTAILCRTAHADAPKIDWARRGLVSVELIGVADRHAPNPAVVRGTSRRSAENAARQLLAREVTTLPLAGGGTVADRMKDAEVKARLDRAVEHAIVLSAEPETDGAWRVTMAVPLEAVRLAIAGPRAVPPGGDGRASVIVVEGVRGSPAIGTKVGTLEAASIWVTEVPV
jgi:hypothetical protein